MNEPAPLSAVTAVIVSAGRGSRLLPLTLAYPKCLVQVGGRAILDHQLDALEAVGIGRAVVVAGYRIDQIADHLARSRRDLDVELIFNPFWSVTSSIASVWAAKDHVARPFALMNGDTVFDAGVLDHALAASQPGVNLVVERPAAFEIDDMRVELKGGVVTAVGKDLPDARASHRSLGLIVSRDADGGGYAEALRAVIGEDGGLGAYHHAIVARLAATARVNAVVAERADWQEIDRPQDIASWARGHGEDYGEVA